MLQIKILRVGYGACGSQFTFEKLVFMMSPRLGLGHASIHVASQNTLAVANLYTSRL